MLFMIYIVAVAVLSPSLEWSWVRTLIAGAFFSVPPYGSLIFERWSWPSQKSLMKIKSLHRLLRYKLLVSAQENSA